MLDLKRQELPCNSFHAAYMELSGHDRLRVRQLVMITCGISRETFYSWLKKMDLVSNSDRWIIAVLIFDKDVKQLFKPKEHDNN